LIGATTDRCSTSLMPPSYVDQHRPRVSSANHSDGHAGMVVTTIHRWSPPQRWAPRSRTTTHDHRRGMISPISKPTRQTVWWFRYLSVVTAGLLRWNGAAQPPPHTTPPRQPPHVSAGQTLVFWCADRPICAVWKNLSPLESSRGFRRGAGGVICCAVLGVVCIHPCH
jgi:hypothetical protein